MLLQTLGHYLLEGTVVLFNFSLCGQVSLTRHLSKMPNTL